MQNGVPKIKGWDHTRWTWTG